MLGFKFYPALTIEVLKAFVHEYGVITQSQLRAILLKRDIENKNVESLLLKLRRSAKLSHLLGDDGTLVFANDCIAPTKRIKILEKLIWVLLEYIEESDYHFCCLDVKNQISPCICFGSEDKHYELFYVPKENEKFFNIRLEAFEREMIYKISMKKGETEAAYKHSVLSTKRLVVLDDFSQINELKIDRVVAYCTVDTENLEHNIVYKMMEDEPWN